MNDVIFVGGPVDTMRFSTNRTVLYLDKLSHFVDFPRSAAHKYIVRTFSLNERFYNIALYAGEIRHDEG